MLLGVLPNELLGVLPEEMLGLLPVVVQEAQLHRVIEVGHLELVVVVIPTALQFGGHKYMVVGLLVVGLVGTQAVEVGLGGRARCAYALGVGVVVLELELAQVVGPKHVKRFSFMFHS